MDEERLDAFAILYGFLEYDFFSIFAIFLFALSPQYVQR